MKKLTLIFLVLFIQISVFAEIIADKNLNYSMDIPEGFHVESADTYNKSYLFAHKDSGVQFILKVYQKENSSASEVLKEAMTKLSATADYDDVNWEDSPCTIASMNKILGKECTGWSLCAPLEKKDNYVSVIAWSDAEDSIKWQQFILSTLNSLTVSDKTARAPGIFMAYAFPKSKPHNISLKIDGKNINCPLDNLDAEANQFVIDLEFAVFKLYVTHNKWKEAWQRYYRIVFRDTYGRLGPAADAIYQTLYPLCLKERPEDPETAYITKLLSWVQDFQYGRNQSVNSTDLTSPVAALSGTGNDCDSRSLLLCALMQQADIDSILLISREFSHAMCAFDVKGMGQRFETGYGSFLMCETTAKVTPGIIAQEHADRTKWIVVD